MLQIEGFREGGIKGKTRELRHRKSVLAAASKVPTVASKFRLVAAIMHHPLFGIVLVYQRDVGGNRGIVRP